VRGGIGVREVALGMFFGRCDKAQPAATMKISHVTSGAVMTMAAPQIRSPR
jgi:hypothetical protein